MSPLVVGCDAGHRFDVNKRGYVSLIASTSKVVGDSAAMLDARAQVLASGVYSPIVDALIELARPAAASEAGHQGAPARTSARAFSSDARPRILDAGCGTGYYLRELLGAVGGQGLAMDLSPAAVGRAVRSQGTAGVSDARVDGLVADTWQPLPIRDGAADIILNVFAPRNIPEFHRVLATDGVLLVVVPTAGHLAELRAARPLRDGGRMLDVPPDKAAQLSETIAPYFARDRQENITFTIRVGEGTAGQLVAMGPSAHHVTEHAATADKDAATFRNVTASVDILRFRRREVYRAK
ncbi:MAG: rRNA (guanine745-N1)-methyltransferase [Microbacteriaceae bacterium]|nr:rRNA (guanine745-N1)-methyltransferase [Microbacteriaceae bacterium]